MLSALAATFRPDFLECKAILGYCCKAKSMAQVRVQSNLGNGLRRKNVSSEGDQSSSSDCAIFVFIVCSGVISSTDDFYTMSSGMVVMDCMHALCPEL